MDSDFVVARLKVGEVSVRLIYFLDVSRFYTPLFYTIFHNVSQSHLLPRFFFCRPVFTQVLSPFGFLFLRVGARARDAALTSCCYADTNTGCVKKNDLVQKLNFKQL